MSEVIFRKDKVVNLSKGKSVLHLGFIQHMLYEQQIKNGDWLHNKLDEVASKLVGLDYLKDEVANISEKYGYECYYGDAMKLEDAQISEKFDVIICGELIEHVENPGLMLNGIKRFMHENSTLIITTPNPWSLNRMKLILFKNLENKWLNKEHVSWFSYGTLEQLLDRKGYQEKKYGYYYNESVEKMKKSNSLANRIKFIFKTLLLKITPVHLYDGLFFEVQLKK